MQKPLDHGTVKHSMQPDDTPELRALYKGFEEQHLKPLWTQLGNLMPMHPKPKAVPHVWKWSKLYPLAKQSGDLVRMSRGDLLLTPGWNFHGHHNNTDKPMAWIDGLDIPFSYQNDVGFFEFGSERVTDYATPNFSRSERLWCHPGLRPLSGLQNTVSSPVGAYRWEHTDRALTEQLLLEDEGQAGHRMFRTIAQQSAGR